MKTSPTASLAVELNKQEPTPPVIDHNAPSACTSQQREPSANCHHPMTEVRGSTVDNFVGDDESCLNMTPTRVQEHSGQTQLIHPSFYELAKLHFVLVDDAVRCAVIDSEHCARIAEWVKAGCPSVYLVRTADGTDFVSSLPVANALGRQGA